MVFIRFEPDNFQLERTTVWSFPERGKWATHSGSYRGNWSPYVPRNLILRYSKTGDMVLDQFAGSGTTLIEAKLLNRNAIGVDINPLAVELSKANLSFQAGNNANIAVKVGNARDLCFIESNSIDLVCTHPPYSNIIRYSPGIADDLSRLSYDAFIVAMHDVASEAYRVLKSGGVCAFMIGDIRRKGFVKPLGMDTVQVFIQRGLTLREIIIKEQHNCKSTRIWASKDISFLLLSHEYIFVLEKP